jgi:hypothetical protein
MDWERRLADLWASNEDHTEQASDDLARHRRSMANYARRIADRPSP